VAEVAEDDWINVSAAAGLLGLDIRTVSRLIARGELPAVVARASVWKRNGRVGERRDYRLQRRDVEGFIERARVRPGDLRLHLGPLDSPPSASLAAIRRRCREDGPALTSTRTALDVTLLGNKVTIWQRSAAPDAAGPPARRRAAQLRYDPSRDDWLVFYPTGHDHWEPYGGREVPMDVDDALTAVLTDPMFFA
jgi:hypothetical protein